MSLADRDRPAERSVLLVGSSHAEVIHRAYPAWARKDLFELRTMLLHDPRYRPWGTWLAGEYILNPELVSDLTDSITEHQPGQVAMMIGGSTHFGMSGVNNPRPFDFIIPGREDLPFIETAELLPHDLVKKKFHREEINILKPLLLARKLTPNVCCICAPPPVGDPAKIMAHLPKDWIENAAARGIAPPAFRHKVWLVYTGVVSDICRDHGIEMIFPPPHTIDAQGFLKEEFRYDALHGNARYGQAVLAQLHASLQRTQPMAV